MKGTNGSCTAALCPHFTFRNQSPPVERTCSVSKTLPFWPSDMQSFPLHCAYWVCCQTKRDIF